ncbi:MAG: aminoglycoside phosphotransferase family protein [Methylohalobius sp.]|nr:aminoglycoside phosphotransferase family protein [Methylohalobius sp.]
MNPVALACHFALPGQVAAVEPLGGGLINVTYRVVTDRACGVLQRLNRQVFPRPDQVVANLRRLQRHWDGLVQPKLRLPSLISTLSGEDWLRDQDGEYWRMLEYLDGVTLVRIETPALAEALGRALGGLHWLLAALDPAELHDPLPGFHCTPKYLAALERARWGARTKRSGPLESLFAWIEEHETWASSLDRARRAGQLPLRIIHGDPKLDNLLFDGNTLQPLAWVDLDTVGPGLIHYDIGDCLRSVCHQAGGFELDLVEIVLGGWWAELNNFLDPQEIHWVPQAIALLPFELGVRFLTDYLEGNRYFKVNDPEENLNRALEQFALARQIMRQDLALRKLWRKLTQAPGR